MENTLMASLAASAAHVYPIDGYAEHREDYRHSAVEHQTMGTRIHRLIEKANPKAEP